MTTRQSSGSQGWRGKFVRAMAGTVAVGALGAAGAVALRADTDDTRAAPGTGSGRTASPADRGDLVSAVRVQSLTRDEVARTLEESGSDPGRVRYGVDAYRLVHRTVDATGAPTQASGLLVLPRSGAGQLDLVSYGHGSLSRRQDAPSTSATAGHRTNPLLFASAGYAAAAPDYLGLGEGEGSHPWLEARTEATASADLLRAADTFATRNGRTLGHDILVAGFSQGAHAAMALAEELESGAVEGFTLKALAAANGPYAMERSEIPAMLSGRTHPMFANYGLARLVTVRNAAHGLYKKPTEYFRAPYAARVEGLFNGEQDNEAVMKALPASLEELFTDKAMRQLRSPSGAWARALRANDATCRGWANSGVRIRLFTSAADEAASADSSKRCLDELRETGARATLTDFRDLDHIGSGGRAMVQALDWFTSLK